MRAAVRYLPEGAVREGGTEERTKKSRPTCTHHRREKTLLTPILLLPLHHFSSPHTVLLRKPVQICPFGLHPASRPPLYRLFQLTFLFIGDNSTAKPLPPRPPPLSSSLALCPSRFLHSSPVTVLSIDPDSSSRARKLPDIDTDFSS
jgi:hypothetical protein